MPKKSYRELAKKRAEKQAYLWQVFQRTPGFRDYLSTLTDPPLEPLIDWLRTPDGEQARTKEAIIDFLKTPDGEALARKMGLYPPSKMAAIVVPYRRARIVNGVGDISPHLQEGRFLHLKVNLAESLTIIRPTIEFQIQRYKRHVEQRPQRVRHRAAIVSCLRPRLKGKWLHIKLDLMQDVLSLLALVESALSQFKNVVQSRPKRRGFSPNEKDFDFYDRIQSGESPRTIGQEAPEYNPKGDPQEARRQEARRAFLKIKNFSE